jgi:hypothetical protein
MSPWPIYQRNLINRRGPYSLLLSALLALTACGSPPNFVAHPSLVNQAVDAKGSIRGSQSGEPGVVLYIGVEYTAGPDTEDIREVRPQGDTELQVTWAGWCVPPVNCPSDGDAVPGDPFLARLKKPEAFLLSRGSSVTLAIWIRPAGQSGLDALAHRCLALNGIELVDATGQSYPLRNADSGTGSFNGFWSIAGPTSGAC